MNRIFLYLLASLVTFQSCKHEIDPNLIPKVSNVCHEDTVYFVEQVLPILQGCATSGCHTGTLAKEGVKLDSYSNIINTGKVSVGNANNSELYEVLVENGDDIMPPWPKSSLSEQSINMIRTWINQGALYNSCPDVGCDVDSVSFANDIYPIVNNYCSYCHQGSSPDGSIIMTNYEEIVVMCSDENFLNIIQDFGNPMPKNTSGLTPCQVDQFRKWINDGYPNN